MTPPVPLLVPGAVFDAFGWSPSARLDWGRPAGRPLERSTKVTSANPPGMVFVMRGECTFLPRELAALHVAEMGFTQEWALAPWGIDDATDLLFEHRTAPEQLLWLATGSIAGLFWGLHDWAHFHNHGPFEERALTELQCDAAALAWMWTNRPAIDLTEEEWERVRGEVVGVGRARFAEEGKPFEEESMGAERLRALLPQPSTPVSAARRA
ncbi:MAG TPA: hypothetical protein VGI39_06930 [Polyangiaceae bacterium]